MRGGGGQLATKREECPPKLTSEPCPLPSKCGRAWRSHHALPHIEGNSPPHLPSPHTWNSVTISRSTPRGVPSALASPLRVTMSGPISPVFSCSVGLSDERYMYNAEL